jgi:hypothetical protein|eukprot:COSAG02_NODE_10447_length_1939_cov_1.539130_3_plen_94_part_00
MLQVGVAATKARRRVRRQRVATLHLQFLHMAADAVEKQHTAAATTTVEEEVCVEVGAVLLWTLHRATGLTGRITTSQCHRAALTTIYAHREAS